MSPVAPATVMPGSCEKRCQMLGPPPSASVEPSIWYADVATPQRKSRGKGMDSVMAGQRKKTTRTCHDQAFSLLISKCFYRIDSSCLNRWYDTIDESNQTEQQCRRRHCDRIRSLQTKQHGARELRQADRGKDSRNATDQGHHANLPQHHCPHAPRVRAERHAHADLSSALRDGIREDA